MLEPADRLARGQALRLAAFVACVCAPPAALAQFSFQPLPEVGSNGLLKVSADGKTVAGSAQADGIEQAALWTAATGTVRLGGLPGGDGSSLGLGVSANGRFVVGRGSSGNGLEAFLWSAGSGMVALGDLSGSGPFDSVATGVSADGSVVVGQSTRAASWRAFRWTAVGGMADLGSLGSGFSAANAVSRDGSLVVGTSRTAAAQEAFRWTPSGGMLALGGLAGGGQTFRATAVSADGKVIVGVGADSISFQAFRWTQETGAIPLGTFDPGNPGSSAAGVSADGRVVVGMGSGVDADGSGEAFVWFPGRGILDLRKYLLGHGVAGVQGWRLSEATGVADDGRTLVGWGVDPQGARSGWLAHIDIDDTAPPPAAPSQLTGKARGSKVALRWTDNADDETGFEIERCEGKACSNFVRIALLGADAQSYADKAVQPDTRYRYRVRAFNEGGASAYSNAVTVHTLRH
jgi:probable HAF family extracellular repeat protein